MIELLYQTDLKESNVGLICALTEKLYKDPDMENKPNFDIQNLEDELTPEVAHKIEYLERP